MKESKIYFPESIIVILLLLFCFVYFQNTQKHYAMDLIINDPTEFKNLQTQEFLSKREFKNITLTGNEKSGNNSLELIELKLKEMIKSKDSITGIKIHFSDEAEYWSFVESLNMILITLKDGIHSWIYENDIYIGYQKPKITNG
jgi:hypothetical protein